MKSPSIPTVLVMTVVFGGCGAPNGGIANNPSKPASKSAEEIFKDMQKGPSQKPAAGTAPGK